MPINRRDFLNKSAALALLAGGVSPCEVSTAYQTAPQPGSVEVSEYWANFYDDTIAKRGPNTAPLAKPDRKTLYLHAPDSGTDVAYADTLSIKDLPQYDGDVNVKMAISQYRPGKGDVSTDTSHFRIDTAQSFDYMNIAAPAAWAVIASLVPDKLTGKIPTIDQLGFKAQAQSGKAGADPNEVKQLVLPNGVGKFSVNITRIPSDSVFSKVLMTMFEGATEVFPLLTMPGISIPAAKTFTELLGKWMNRAQVVVNGNLTPVIATSKVPDTFMPQDPMPLKSGYYVMVPDKHKDELNASLPNLTMMNGFLVAKNSQGATDLETRAKQAIPGVSYGTLRIAVSKADTPSCGTKAPTSATDIHSVSSRRS